jgi:hypothetical protein
MSTNLPINIPESPYYYLDGHEISYEITDYDDDKYFGDTIEEAIEKFSRAYANLGTPGAPSTTIRGLGIRLVIDIPAHVEAVSARVRELNAERKAKEAAAKLAQDNEFYNILLDAWQKRVDALNAEAGDYTPEGFNKRWKALQDQKPVKP